MARLIPIISFDLISYAAGASTIKIPQFLLATFIEMLPALIIVVLWLLKVVLIKSVK